MHAPHSPVPQPYFVPVSFNPSRMIHSKGVCGGASVDAGAPFTVNWIVIPPSLYVVDWLRASDEPRPTRAHAFLDFGRIEPLALTCVNRKVGSERVRPERERRADGTSA